MEIPFLPEENNSEEKDEKQKTEDENESWFAHGLLKKYATYLSLFRQNTSIAKHASLCRLRKKISLFVLNHSWKAFL